MPENISENKQDAVLPWQKYLLHKQLLRKRLRRNYAWLLAFTLLFGLVTIGLRLHLRYPQYFEKLRLSWGQEPGGEPALDSMQPTAAQLKMLIGQQWNDEQLADRWGESRVLAGSDKDLELRYFTQTKVYLLRKHERVVYAGKKSP